jgi:hypothetical protein
MSSNRHCAGTFVSGFAERTMRWLQQWIQRWHEWSNSRCLRKFTQSMALHTASRPKKVGTSFAPEIGPDLFCAASRMGLEGLVSNHRERPYRGGRQKHWVTMAAFLTEPIPRL